MQQAGFALFSITSPISWCDMYKFFPFTKEVSLKAMFPDFGRKGGDLRPSFIEEFIRYGRSIYTDGELYFGVGVYIGMVLCEEQKKFFRRNIRDTIIAAIISRHPISPSIPATTVLTDTSDIRGNDILTDEIPS